MILRIGVIALLLTLVGLVLGQDVNLVKEIVVQGNSRVSKEAIFSSMTTKVGSLYSQDKLDADQRALEDLGFFSAVDVRGVPIQSGANWQVLVTVQEFPVIKEIRITGNSAIKTDAIIKALSPNLKPGNVFNRRDIAPSVAAIRKLYSDKGFFGDVGNIAPLPDSPGTLDVSIVEARVGIVSVQGNRVTKDWVMRRLIKTRPGEIFNTTKWGNDLRRLYNTQWFDSVRSLQDDSRELGVYDLTADVKEAKSGTFNVGLQLDPQSSLAGILRYSQSNVGGTGQSIGINFLQATQGGGPSVDFDYTNPFFDTKNTVLRASIYSRVIYRFAGSLFGGGGSSLFSSNNAYTERRTGFSLGLSRSLNDYVSVGSSVRVERVTTENLSNLVDQLQTPNDPTDDQMTNNFIQQDGDVAVLSLGLTRNRRDVDLDPSKGDYLQLTLEPGYSNITHVGGLTTGTNILGPNYFLRGTVDYRTYWTPDKPRGQELDAPKRVFAFRVRYGSIQGNVPFFEQYFAGGSDTLRGYPDDRFWGKQTLLTNFELRYPLQKSFSLIGFVDYGGAWGGYGSVNDYTQSSVLKLHLGYGPGLSFRTPLGNIQLFLGFGEGGRTQTHFLIGNSF